MKPATITEIKKELKFRSQEQLIEYCLTMARFKLESKELLTYLVFESENEHLSIRWTQLSKHRFSAAPGAMIKLSLSTGDTHTFKLESRSSLERLRNDIRCRLTQHPRILSRSS